MKNYFNKIALLVIVSISFSACAAVLVGGAAAYTYVSGWLKKDYQAGIKKAYNASIKAVEKNDLEIIEKGQDITYAFVKAKGAKRDIWIKLNRKSESVTSISIRFGVMGDRKASGIIHDSIANLL